MFQNLGVLANARLSAHDQANALPQVRPREERADPRDTFTQRVAGLYLRG